MNDRLSPLNDQADSGLRHQGEMRLSTVMMVDMVGSTEMSEQLGPERSFMLLHDLLKVARSVVTARGGTMMNEMGDGFFALFGAPMSVERASLAACRAALEVCEAASAEAATFKARFGFQPQLRVGLAAGEVLITGQADDGKLNATGNAVNLAARLQALAEPNCVVCSGSVGVETEGWVRLHPLGPQSLKGFTTQIEAFKVLEVIDGGHDRLTQSAWRAGDFVGRTVELGQLMRWNAKDNGAPPVSLIVGEAGIGKTRILNEFAARLGKEKLIVGSCQPTETARPLAPLIEVLRSFADWHPGQPADRLLTALEPILPTEPGDRAAMVKLIGGQALPDGEGNASDAIGLRKALTASLLALGQLPGCVIAIEDMHWIDPLSAEVLMSVVGSAPHSFRMLGTTRPVEWLSRLPKNRIEFVVASPMQTGDIGAMAQALMGEAANEGLVDRVAKSSEGNPFFAIEILHHIAAMGDGVEAGRIGAIQNIALARFDRLEPATKSLLRMASVLGRTFRFDVLRQAAEAEETDIAAVFGAAEGIIEPDPADPEGSGRFHHILFRDSIYATIPSASRREMHHVAAEAIQAWAGDNAWTVAGQLADHYELAGKPVPAVDFLRVAARSAYGLNALESCKSLMERAFRLIEPDLDKFETDLLEDAVSIWMRCLDVMDLFRSVLDVSSVWLPRLRTEQGSPTEALLLALTSKAHCHLANFEQSKQMVTEALDMAERLGHDRTIAYAKVVMMRMLSDSGVGGLEEVERLFEETRAFTEDLSDEALYANRMFHMMAAYRTEGLMRQASAVNDEIQAFGERHKKTHVKLVAGWNRSLNAIEANDFRTALLHAEAGLEGSIRNSAVREVFTLLKLSSQLGLGIDISLEDVARILDRSDRRGEFATRNAAATQIGYARFSKGRILQGYRQLRKSEPVLAATGTVEARRFFLLHRAELLLMLGGLIKVEGPVPKLGIADIAVAIYLRLTARRSAKALLNRLLSEFDHPEGLFVARARTCCAVIAAAEGKTDAARDDFALAERLFRDEGLTAELDRLSGLRRSAGL